jgi:hypothetical protein
MSGATGAIKTVSLVLVLGFAFTFNGCAFADWWAYNVSSAPQQGQPVVEKKLLSRWSHEENDKEKNQMASLLASLSDVDWSSAFQHVANHLQGWTPDFCSMVYAYDDVFPGDFKHNEESFLEAFWRSYLINVYFDSIEETPTARHHSNVHEYTKAMQARNNNIIKSLQKGQAQAPEMEAEAIPKAPKCNDGSNASSKGVIVPFGSRTNAHYEGLPTKVSRTFLSRWLGRIDADHSEILVDREPGKKLPLYRKEWQDKHEKASRPLTVSTLHPASLSPSIKKPDSPPPPEKKAFLFQLTAEGQRAFIQLANKMTPSAKPLDDCRPDDKACNARFSEKVNKLMEMMGAQLAPVGQTYDYDARQSFEVTVSSILNSPDIANRIEYLTTYLSFFPYPYPANGQVLLEKEYWKWFGALHGSRRTELERQRSLEADLHRAWREMQVRIENVETLVNYVPIEIAHVVREANQEVKLQPKVGFPALGTELEAGSTGSSLRTVVTERLLKELDRRSSWLNPERNELRITQRGMEAVNIAGSLKEHVTLHVPSAMTNIPVINFENDKLSVKLLQQPLYSKVTGIAITIAVVREPYKFRRSGSEKFGLPDSADSYNVTVVSDPVQLTLWEWERTIQELYTSDVGVYRDDSSNNPLPLLRFRHPTSGIEGLASLAGSGRHDFLKEFRKGLFSIISDSTSKPTSLMVRCSRKTPWSSGLTPGIYFTVEALPKKSSPESEKLSQNTNALSSTDAIWLGVDNGKGMMVPFNGSENQFLRELAQDNWSKCQ